MFDFRLEAKNCDAVVVANIDKKKLKAQTVKYSTVSFLSYLKPGKIYLPCVCC